MHGAVEKFCTLGCNIIFIGMKLWKHTLITALLFTGAATAVTFTACESDSCLDLVCKNGGSCAEGFCRCPTGYEGTECEVKSAAKFVGFYVGNVKCGILPPLKDTVEIFLVANPNQVKLVQHSRIADTMFGTVVNQNLNIPEITFSDYRRAFNVTSDSSRLIYSVQEIESFSGNEKSMCQFIGFK
jgi:hypothetical protein